MYHHQPGLMLGVQETTSVAPSTVGLVPDVQHQTIYESLSTRLSLVNL